MLTCCIAIQGMGLFVGEAQAQDTEAIPEEMKLVASNSALELYLDEASTAVAVKVKESGDIWFSNPPAAGEDTIASTYHQNLMRSQIALRYYNASVQASEMDNYNDSVLEEQFEIAYGEDGVSITYVLGEQGDKFILPQVIREERFLQYVDQMDEKVAKITKRAYNYMNLSEMRESKKAEALEQYPQLTEYNIYVLQSGAQDYKKEELTGYFLEVGYTAEEMAFDNEENNVEMENEKPWFKVTLEYRLEGDNLIAMIDPEKIEYDTANYYLVDVELLKFFGAAGPGEEGYIFVPDGSGALIYLNNGKSSNTYIAPVYGRDISNSFNSRSKSEVDQAVTVRMPVYGLKTGDKAWFAIIEGSAAMADINAETAGQTNTYNNVYAGFTYLSNGSISLGDIIGSQSFQMYSIPEFGEKFQVRFNFLHGGDANYTGMAHCYQDYLEQSGALSRKASGDTVPFYASLIGAIEKTKSIFGIKYDATQSLTTYAEAARIVEELQAAGVGNLKVQYKGWSKGGLHGTAPKAASALSVLEKGGVSLKSFLSDMASKGVTVFHSAELQFVYKSALGDGYASGSHAPKYYDKSTVRTGEYLIPNGMQKERDIDLISPYYVVRAAGHFISKAEKYNFTGISVNSLASELYSDYMDTRYTDRNSAAGYNSEAMKQLGGAVGGNVLASNANAYALGWLSDMIEVPFDSNRSRLIDESIPFYAIVLHGYMDFAGPALNLADDFTTTVLQSVECGAGVSFEWIYGNNSLLKDTDFDYLYSIGYSSWKDNAIAAWERVNSAVGKVQGQKITNHEKLAAKVYATTYEDGTKVIVNYGKTAAEAEGYTVAARDFIVVQGGNGR